MSQTTIILGPPGTGKTTTLLNYVDQALAAGTPPDRVGFVSFTRKATEEARDRAIRRFKFTRDDMPYFRTIHSLAFRQSGLSTQAVMKKAHYQELGHLVGLALTGGASLEEGATHGMAKGDRLLFLEGLSRVRCEPLEETWDKDGEDTDWWELEQLGRALGKYKKAQGLVDYTDMLHRFCGEGYAPKLDILFVDEAQDLSRLQWRVVARLMANAGRTIIAGDDDQAIFRWSGADVDTFVTLPGEARVLTQSHRISGPVHHFSAALVATIVRRRVKEFRPASHAGSVSYSTGLEDLPLDQGEWLLLVRNGYQARPIVEYCERNGYPVTWKQPHGEEATVPAARLRVSTIHGAKGGEADNVALFTDMSHRTYLSMQRHPDDEARVFYVGATRARCHLHVVNPQTDKHFHLGGT